MHALKKRNIDDMKKYNEVDWRSPFLNESDAHKSYKFFLAGTFLFGKIIALWQTLSLQTLPDILFYALFNLL